MLLGIVGPDGRVAYVPQRLEVDREFVQLAKRGRTPEKRFRFSSRCAESACAQWTGSRCGVIDRVLDLVPASSGDAELPACSIRPECRWWQQSGADACAVCPEVVTDTR